MTAATLSYHALARLLRRRSHPRKALATELKALDACGESKCKNRLLTQATRRVEFFQAVVDLGVENPLLSPDAVQLAYARSSREVRSRSAVSAPHHFTACRIGNQMTCR